MSVKWYFYFNRKGENSLLNDCKKIEPDNILVCQELESRKYALFKNFASFSKFFHSTPVEERCFYEMIQLEVPRKPYFDIDLDNGKDFNISKLVDIIKKTLSEKIKILVFTSHVENKKSYHIVVDDVYFSKVEELQNFYEKTIESLDEEEKKAVDGSVYKSVQQFRMLGSHKYRKTNTKILEETLSYNYSPPKMLAQNERGIFNYDLSCSLVANTNYCDVISGFEISQKIEKSMCRGASQEGDLEDVLRIFYASYSSDDFGFSECKEKNGNLLIVLRRLNPTYCKQCKRLHENENPFVVTLGEFRNVYFYCRRKEKKESEYLGSLGLPKLEDIKLEDVPNIDEMVSETETTEILNTVKILEELSIEKTKTPTRKSRNSVLKSIPVGNLVH